MKFFWYNLVPILLIMLTAYMIAFDKQYWGWVLVAALLCAVVPKTSKD